MQQADIGLIGLGVMGANLALNIAENGYRVAVYNRTVEKTHAFHQEAGALKDKIIPCETTTRHASDLGYTVDYVSEATLTFAMTNAAGRTFSADEIRARTELVLDGRFARIVTVDEALNGAGQALAA